MGFVPSTVAALGQPDRYWAIVLPGMLVGLVAALATQRARPAVILAWCLLPNAVLAEQP